MRFLSGEPLLGPINLRPDWVELEVQAFGSGGVACFPRLDWVIVGGESGPGARPMHPNWARQIRDQCAAAGVPLFFKQWGEWVTEDQSPEDITLPSTARTFDDAAPFYRVGKKAAGRELDGRTWDEMPEVPA